MAFWELRASTRILSASGSPVTAAGREAPERIVLGVAEGLSPSDKPPVRIFLGTQPEQYRAERVFIWSIEQVRDPSRVYEIFLMKSLHGFDRRGWTTGFTNYRFAIPHFAGNRGRAIYNDVDQIYLADPGELFDLPMDGHAFLAIAQNESSVMLIDCARMAPVWTLPEAQRLRKGQLLKKALADPGCWGPLAPEWNARDEDEYDPKRAKCVHFTTLHTQPWRPTPRRFAYLSHPMGALWYQLEDSANQAGYQVFTAARPSLLFRQLLEGYRSGGREPRPLALAQDERRELVALIDATGSRSLLHVCIGGAAADAVPAELAGLAVTQYDLADPSMSLSPDAGYDGVLLDVRTGELPTDDVPWLIAQAFGHAQRFVCARLDSRRHAAPGRLKEDFRDLDWWQGMFRLISARYPAGIRWQLLRRTSSLLAGKLSVREGGQAHGGDPTVWVFTDGSPEHRRQALALAAALNWPYEEKPLLFNALAALPNRLMGASVETLQAVSRATLRAPWPDLIIAAGRRAAPSARWIGKQSRGLTRLVFVGDAGGEVAEEFDALVTPRHARLWAHPHRIEALLPLSSISPQALADAGRRWPDRFKGLPRPWIACFVGWDGERRGLDVATARRIGEDLARFAAELGGAIRVLPGPHLTDEVAQAFAEASGVVLEAGDWHAPAEDRYLADLTESDLVIVGGEGGALIGEAAAAGKPLYLYPLPGRRPGVLSRLSDRVVARALSRPPNKRGTTRPQQGLEYVCARLVVGGYVRPTRRPAMLYQALFERGIAAPFGRPLPDKRPGPLREADQVAVQLKLLLANPRVF
jgi:mitochondrial fission protein ELM1